MNRKWLYRTDITLRCLFLLTLLSGLSMHAVGHGCGSKGIGYGQLCICCVPGRFLYFVGYI